jgi:hypothetical protein
MGSSGSYVDRLKGAPPTGLFDLPRQNVYRGMAASVLTCSASASSRSGAGSVAAAEDVDMFEVFVSQGQNLHGLHPTKAQLEEKLPEGFRRNYAGFLLRDLNREVEVNQDAVKHEMEYLVKFATIVCFVGGRPTDHQLRNWLETLCKRVDGVITLGRNLGKGFFLLKANHEEVARKLLPLTPYRSTEGMCVFQHWTAGFNPNVERSAAGKGGSAVSPKIPTWVTLRQIPDEFLGVCHQIAAGIGEILGTNEANGRAEDPKFCVALDSRAGWEPSVVVRNSITQTKVTILIDYNFLPIRCRYCFSTEHCIKDCPARSDGRNQRNSQGQPRQQRYGVGSRPQSARQQGTPSRQQQQPAVNSRISGVDKGKQIMTNGEEEAQSPATNSKQLTDKDGFQVYVSPRNKRNGKALQRWDVNAHGVHTSAPEVKKHGEPSNNQLRNQENKRSPVIPEDRREPSSQKTTQVTMAKEKQLEKESKGHNLEDLNLPHSRLDSLPVQEEMTWSPTNVSEKKRMGSIISPSESDP